MPISPGEKLGPYEILAPIGKGGMGEVWKAHDPRLNRDIAIKVSAAQFSERFEREAHAIAALNHPNICQIYDVGPNYLVIELIEGSALKGPLPIDQTLKFAAQVCDALDAAHKKGITHRDLKPSNILVTKAGVKLLDFGLAKVTLGYPAADDSTITSPLTVQGEVLGTLQYMSPEQVQGQEADARSDIFSFGLVLYEMLTGKRVFKGSSAASVIAAIMEHPAPSAADVAPAALDRVLKKCLAKDPDERWQTARDLKDELEWIASAFGLVTAIPIAVRRRRLLPWIAVAGGMTAIAAIALWAPWRSIQRVDRPLVRLDVDLGADVSLPAPALGGSSVVISPDGTRLAYVSGRPVKLFTRRLDQKQATELPGTEGARAPFFSPDGQWIGFSAGFRVNKISVEGGAVVSLVDASTFAGASWGEDGSIIVSDAFGKGLMRIPASGGPPETVVALTGGDFALTLPQILPGGKAVLFTAGTAGGAAKANIEVVTLADRHRKIVTRGAASAFYLATSNGAGHLLYTNKSTLFAIPFDLDALETRGTAVPVLDEVAYQALSETGELASSRTGTLVYRRPSDTASAMTTIQWVDTAGQREPLRAKPGVYSALSLSPDGKKVALLVTEGGSQDVWVYDQQRDAITRLTSSGSGKTSPIWSPDGQYIVFGNVGNGMFVTRSDGASQPQSLLQSKSIQFPSSFAPDGKRLAYSEIPRGQVWTVPVEDRAGQLKTGKPEQFLKSNFDDQAPAFSPDGRWLAYQSNESGRNEAYVRAFPPSSSGQGGKWQISNSGGSVPRWSRKGNELLYRSGDQILVASYMVKGDTFIVNKPRVWIAKFAGAQWDLAPDGTRVAVLTQLETAQAPSQEHEVIFLENFSDELQRKVPVGK